MNETRIELTDILDTRPTIQFDGVVWDHLFNDSPASQLATTDNDPALFIRHMCVDRVFKEWVGELAVEYSLDDDDILRSISRTLHEALRD